MPKPKCKEDFIKIHIMPRCLHTTNHRGTEQNIQHVCKLLDCDLDTHRYTHGLYLSRKEADNIYTQRAEVVSQYDILVFTDTSMAARPYLQNLHKHRCFIVVYMTNRFDWGLFAPRPQPQYDEYVELMRYTSHYPSRVVFCADNEYDRFYASHVRNIQVLASIIPQTPQLTHPMGNVARTWCVYDRGTSVSAYMASIQTQIVVYSPQNLYESTEWLAANHAACLHLPYQTNIMSVWEQLGCGLPYIIPTKRLLIELIKTTSWYYWEEKEHLDESINRSVWYSPENTPLFIYFDQWSDLNHITNTQLLEKRTQICTHMDAHNTRHLETWQRVFSLAGSSRIAR